MKRFFPCLLLILLARPATANAADAVRPSEEDTSADAPNADTPTPVARFGSAGQLVLGSNFGFSGYSSNYSGSDAHFSGYSVAPGLDVFVLDNLSVGADLSVSHSTSTGYGPTGALSTTASTRLGAGARVAWNVSFSPRFSWWPRLTVGYSTSRVEEPYPSDAPAGLGTAVTQQHGGYAVVYAPLLLHPVAHFFVGFGPYVSRGLGQTASNALRPVHDATSAGAYVLVGGWL